MSSHIDIGGYIVRNYLLETPAGGSPFDTGYPEERRHLSALERLAALDDLKYIFLTHAMTTTPDFWRHCCQSSRLGYLHPGGVPPCSPAKTTSPRARLFLTHGGAVQVSLKGTFLSPGRPGDRALFVSDEADQAFKAIGCLSASCFLPAIQRIPSGFFWKRRRIFCGDAAMTR